MMSNRYDDEGEGGFRRRRPRPVTDYGSAMVQYIRNRKPAYKGTSQYQQERPSLSYVIDVLPPIARLDVPAESIPVRHLHTSLGKSKKPVTVVRWMPEGRRLLAGVHNGEFMLWNGMSFNFETVTAMGSSSLRAAEWSNRKDWLVAANDEGTVYYLQPTLNNPHQFKAHDAPIRDLAFAPTDAKFVTASDDNTLKIWDFTSSTNESTFSDHGWDVKACDWHPTKGLVVSGSKDHSVRLWDPRTTRNLTTLHGHKNAITATVFSRLRDQLLATSARDGSTRIFDLRLMRDVAILRGHEKGVTTLSWHPIHPSLISTGGDDGALHTYLLTEPNTPPTINTATISPYNTPDPSSAPAQSIYPAHRISHAHDSSIWSLDWHPMGHILASGSNDHYTRFWSRSLPGSNTCFKDQFHLGEEGAEAQGTWDRKFMSRQKREMEEQEEEDEEQGLQEQHQLLPLQQTGTIPGLPGINMANPNGMPGLGNLPQFGQQQPTSQQGQHHNDPYSNYPPHNNLPPPPPIPGSLPAGMNMSPQALQQLMQSAREHRNPLPSHLPPPPLPLPHHPPGQIPGQVQVQGGAGGGIDFSRFQNMQLPQGFPPPPPPPGMGGDLGGGGGGGGIPGLGGGDGGGGIPGLGSGGGGNGDAQGGVRRRIPLPSQSEGFKAEQARGNFRIAR